MAGVEWRKDAVKKTDDDVIDPAFVRVLGGVEEQEMSLAEAADKDSPEGTVTIQVSATLFQMLVERIPGVQRG